MDVVGELSILNRYKNAKYSINKLHTVIGHDPNCEIRLYGNNIADKHCILTNRKGSKPTIRNLNEICSTLINGNDIKMKDHILEDGALISIGPYSMMWSSEPNSVRNSRESYMSNRSLASLNRLVPVVSPLKRHSYPKEGRLGEVQNINKSLYNSLKSDEDEFDSPISFPSSVKRRGSQNRLFTHSTPARFRSRVSKNNIYANISTNYLSDLISPSTSEPRSTNRSHLRVTVTDLNNLPRSLLTTSFKSPSNTLNSLLGSNILTPSKKVHFKNNSTLIACHKKKTQKKSIGEPSELKSSLTVIGKKKSNSLKGELARLTIDMNTSQNLTSRRLSKKRSSSSPRVTPVDWNSQTIIPAKDNETGQGSTRTSASETQLAFTQEESTSKKDELLNFSQLKRHSSPKEGRLGKVQNISKSLSNSLKSDDDEFGSLFSSSIKTRGSQNRFFTLPPAPFLSPASKNDIYSNISNSLSKNDSFDLIPSPSTKEPRSTSRSHLEVTVTDLNNLPRSPLTTSFKSPGSNTMNNLFGSDISTPSEKVSFKRKSTALFPSFSKTPSKRGKSIVSESSECADKTPSLCYKYKNLKPEPKLDKNKKAALIACHKKKSTQKESIGEPSEPKGSLTVIGKKKCNSLNGELARLTIEMNASQYITSNKRRFTSSPRVKPINRNSLTIIPKDNDLTVRESTRISASETPLAFTQEESTSNKDELLKALNLSKKSDVMIHKQRPSRRLRSFNKTDLDPKINKNSKDTSVQNNRGDEGVKTLFNDSDTFCASGLRHLFYSSPNSISHVKNICRSKNRSHMSRVFTTSPLVDYTDVSGVKKLFTVSPICDYRNPLGIKELFAREETYYMHSDNVRELFSDVPGPSGILTNAIKETDQKHPSGIKAKIDKIFKKVQFEEDQLQKIAFIEDASAVNILKVRKTRQTKTLKSNKLSGIVFNSEIESSSKAEKVKKNNESPVVTARRKTRNKVQTELNKLIQQEQESTSVDLSSKETTPVARRTRNASKKTMPISNNKITSSKPKNAVKINLVHESPEPKKIPQKAPSTVSEKLLKSKMVQSPVKGKNVKSKKNNQSPVVTLRRTTRNIVQTELKPVQQATEITPVASRKRGHPKKKISVAKTVLKIKIESPAKPKKVVKSKKNNKTPEPKRTKITTQQANVESPKKTMGSKNDECGTSKEVTPSANRKRNAASKKKISVAKTVLKITTKSSAKPKKAVKSKTNSEAPEPTKTANQQAKSLNVKSPTTSKKTVKSKNDESTSSRITRNRRKSKEASPAASRKRNAAPKKKMSVAKTVLKIKVESPAKPKKKPNNKVDKSARKTVAKKAPSHKKVLLDAPEPISPVKAKKTATTKKKQAKTVPKP